MPSSAGMEARQQVGVGRAALVVLDQLDGMTRPGASSCRGAPLRRARAGVAHGGRRQTIFWLRPPAWKSGPESVSTSPSRVMCSGRRFAHQASPSRVAISME